MSRKLVVATLIGGSLVGILMFVIADLSRAIFLNARA